MLHDIKRGSEAQELIRAGINKAADTIKSTMGPLGRYVSIDYDPFAWPMITNDGVTVANNIYLKDKFENIGAKYVRQAASKTNDVAGDGTTTASVLVQALVEEGLLVLSGGTSPVTLRREIESAVKLVLQDIQNQTVVIKQDDLKSLTDIATISSRDDDLGKMIATLVSEIGSDGVITIEDSALADTTVERSEGLKVRGGLLSPFFVNHKAFQQAVYENTPVVVTDASLTQANEVIPIMEKLHAAGHKKAVLIAAQIEGNALGTIIQNSLKKTFDILPLRVIAYGPIGEGYLRDICAATGSTLITDKDGKKLTDFTAADAGAADKVVAGAHEITFIGGQGDSQARVNELQGQIANVKSLEEESLRERIAKLQSKTASIKVGGVIDSEREEIKKRVEDAVNATKAALSDGIVTGGGAALFRAGRKLAGGDFGSIVVRQSCQYPLKQIAKNSEVELDRGDLTKIVDNNDLTYDFRSGEVVNAFKGGVIDPAKVVTTALQNATAAAVLFLITDAAIVTIEDGGEEI
jgi:chaperonin GroEL